MKKAFISYMLLMILFPKAGFGQKGTFTQQPDGILVTVNSEKIQLRVMGEKIIRVTATRSGESLSHQGLVVVNPVKENVKWDVKEETGEVVLITPSLQVKVNLTSGQIQFLNKAGSVLLQENGREITPAVVLDEKTNSIVQQFKLSDTEALYGLGQYQDGNMNLRGKTVDLYQFNMRAAIPVLVSTKNYGLLWDNYSLTKFADGPQGMSIWSEVGDGIDYYFFSGNSIDDVVSAYRSLTGQAPMFAKWAYGFFQSKERYQSQQEITGIVDEFRKRRVPLDVIVQDWHYWDPYKWGSHNINRLRYPDPVGMNNTVHANHAKIIISVWAKFDSTSPNYAALDQKGYLWKSYTQDDRYYNAYLPAARAMYWKQMYDSLYVKGFDGWWLDATEPDLGELRTEKVKKFMNNNLGTGARYFNTYPLMTTTAVYEGQRKVTPDKRVYILTRSAFAGQQRNATTNWSGDVTATWDVFHKQIPAGLNFCFTGIPYWTMDIGAYQVTLPGGYRNDSYKELFTRWYQFGVFCPIFRVHGSVTPREIWRFGEAGSWSYDTQLKFDNLRYRLLPYIYSLAWKVTHENYTIMRGLAFDFAKDTRVYNIDDQFMFGPSILVNPVLQAMYYPVVPTDTGKIIPPDYLKDLNGKPGLTGDYYPGMNFNKHFTTRTDSKISFDWGNDAPMKGMPPDSFSVRWRGYLLPDETGEYTFNTRSDDGTRLYIDNQLVVDAWQDQAPVLTPGKISLRAGKKYEIKLEYYENAMGAVAELYWIKPSAKKISTVKLPGKTREVYLPGTTQWFDFWTGEIYKGGQTIVAPAPIDIMPLYVKAGSIIPMGPFLQYTSEKPADPLEIRIYQGADGSFELYEDEGDNYNYEKGTWATINFRWNDAKHLLIIGERKGSFPGMIEKRTFKIIVVNKSKGNGIDLTETPDKTIQYTGGEQVIQL